MYGNKGSILFSTSFTFQKSVSAIELAVEAVDGAFVIESAAADVINPVSNGCPYVNYSLNCLFAMTSQQVEFLSC